MLFLETQLFLAFDLGVDVIAICRCSRLYREIACTRPRLFFGINVSCSMSKLSSITSAEA
jgi:hypothetical protein